MADLKEILQDSIFVAELIGLICLVLLALARPGLLSRFFEAVEDRFAPLAQRRWMSVLAVGLLALCLRLALVPLLGRHEPAVNDEFSFLLQADTFMHHRLANPPHPMGRHLQTMHVLQEPTYASMYPPAQGVILATGLGLAGRPWVGLALAGAVMCAALCWAFQGWMSPGWALLGGFLAVIRLACVGYWTTTYWGGMHGAIGGALVMGAIPRILREPKIPTAVALGTGLFILANSRPYEGLLISSLWGLFLLYKLGIRTLFSPVYLKRLVIPFMLVVAVGAASTAYFNWRVTNNPLQLPYRVSQIQSHWAQLAFQPPPTEGTYPDEAMRQYYAWVREIHQNSRSLKGFVLRLFKQGVSLWTFFLGPALLLPVFLVILRRWDDKMRVFAVVGGIFCAGVALEAVSNPHYLSPATALIFAITLAAMQQLHSKTSPRGLLLVRLIPLFCVLVLVLRIAAAPLGWKQNAWWIEVTPGNTVRADLQETLKSKPGQHLVVVHYSKDHKFYDEWVYNGADIDGSKVVWARDLGESNPELIRYFKERLVWCVEPDNSPPKLYPYPNDGVRSCGQL